MAAFFHSVPQYALCGYPITLQCVLADEESAVVKLMLSYEHEGVEYSRRMLPTDGFLAKDCYSVYSAQIPAEHVQGKTLCYRFLGEGQDEVRYTVPVEKMGDLPPFLITEHAAEMRNGAHYCEICNPGTEAVDLYDYELLLVKNGKTVGRNNLCDLPGESLLAGGEVAVLRFLTADRLNRFGDVEHDTEDFFATLVEYFPAHCEDIAEHPPRIIYATLASESESGWVQRAGTFEITQNDPHHLHIVKRGSGVEESLLCMALNCDKTSRDVPARTSSLWHLDFRHPNTVYRIATKRPATPGYADEGQVFPNVSDCVVPAILPITPLERVCHASGDLVIRFATFSHEDGNPTVCLLTDGGKRRFTPKRNDDGVWELILPNRLLLTLGASVRYYIEVSGGMYQARLGSAKAPLSVPTVDNAGPAILSIYPANDQAVECDRPIVSVRFFDPAGVDAETSLFCLDGHTVTEGVKWTQDGVTYRPKTPLCMGEHVLELSLRDVLGNRTYSRTAFVCTDGRELNLYRGEVHAHTLESDGDGTVPEAMAYARDVGKVDYFAVTDHCCYLNEQELHDQKAVADSFNQNGKFAALWGYEVSWGREDGFWGHMNVLGGEWFAPASTTPMPQIYERLAADPNAIAMFNHPCDRWGNFGSFSHHTPTLDKRVCLSEIKREEFDGEYALLLARGWHAAPVSNEDNHRKDWTTKTNGTGVVLAHSLTRENVMDAFRKGRTYSTMDNTMEIRYRVNGKWLGSHLNRPKKLTVEIEVSTRRTEGIGDLMLIAEDNILVTRVRAGALKHFCWKIELDPDFDYYYLKIINGDTYSVTAPVFVEGWDELSITDMKAGVSEQADLPHAVCATVENSAQFPLTDVTVDFYLAPTSGFGLRTLLPFERVELGKLEPGERREVSCAFPCVAGNRRVTAIVSGMGGKHRFVDTRFLLLSPLQITKLCSLTSPQGEQENPYAYAEIHNPLCVPVSLKGYGLRARNLEGNHRPNSEIYIPLGGDEIPPGGTVVVWSRPSDCELEVGDFNTHYGTVLEKGKDLLVAPQPFLIYDGGGHFVDVCFGEERLSRAEWGNYFGGEQAVIDMPQYYRATHDMTIRTERFSPEITTSIGAPCLEQCLQVMAPAPSQTQTGGAEREKTVVTKLTKAPLHPLQAAAFVANAFSTFKNLFSEKD